MLISWVETTTVVLFIFTIFPLAFLPAFRQTLVPAQTDLYTFDESLVQTTCLQNGQNGVPPITVAAVLLPGSASGFEDRGREPVVVVVGIKYVGSTFSSSCGGFGTGILGASNLGYYS